MLAHHCQQGLWHSDQPVLHDAAANFSLEKQLNLLAWRGFNASVDELDDQGDGRPAPRKRTPSFRLIQAEW